MFTLYQRWDAESRLTPENFHYILTPLRALEEACRYYDLDRDNYKGRSTHPLPNRLSRPGSPYQRPPRHYADEIHDRLEQELEFGWTLGVIRFSFWNRLDNPFSFNDDGELVFESSVYTHPWFELHVRRLYEYVLANSPGGKPVATVKNHSGVAAGNTLNSKGVGRLLAAGGVYNGNVEGFRQAAQDLGGEAIDGYNQVLNETSKGAAIAVASVAAGLGIGGFGVVNELNSLSRIVKSNTDAYLPSGRLGNPMNTLGANNPVTIGKYSYSAHAIDRMQGRGVPPSAVENAIKTGQLYPTKAGTAGYYDSINNLRVIVNSNTGNVVTVIPGVPK